MIRFFFVLSIWLSGITFRLHGQTVISEIHYHPVEEAAFNSDGTPIMDLTEDVHEFVELYNSSNSAVDLSRWKLSGGVDFEIPSGISLPPRGFLVIAKSPERLAKVQSYGLEVSEILGPYTGQLSNRGETLRLRNGSGEIVDTVAYKSEFPWPLGADALGADQEWTGLRGIDYQYRGRSLERVSANHPGSDPANWLASPVRGQPSPGRPSAVERPFPTPVVKSILLRQSSNGQALIRQNQEAILSVDFTGNRGLGSVRVEYFVDNINLTDEPRSHTGLSLVNEGSLTTFRGILPGFTTRSIIRYRIKAELNGSEVVVSPRPDDPLEWYAYFISPERVSSKPVYDCFISTASLARLGQNISGSPRRVTAPDPPGNPRISWNSTEPAIFVHEGVVRDIRMRHHGSRYNRNPGRNSFKWKFPRYSQYQGTDALFVTDKGSDFVNGHGIFLEANLPVSKVRYIDLYLNGNAVMQRLEQGEFNGDMLDAYHREQHEKLPDTPLEPSGEIYKVVGTIDLNGEGPYGRGDGRKLSKAPWPDLKMYEWTYAQQNNSWRGHTDFKKMIDAMWIARGDTPSNPRPNVTALRSFFTNFFDIDTTLTYLAVENWACPWDDTTQNHFLWRRANGKWSMLPWDCDAWFGRGDNTPATASIYIGEVGDRNNNFRGPNFFKDGFLKAFREEYKQRIYLLSNTLLHPDNLAAKGYGSLRTFAVTRLAAVNQQSGYGPFLRPDKPVPIAPMLGQSVGPGAQLIASEFVHPGNPGQNHASTLWELRSSDGTYTQPILSIRSTDDLTRLQIPLNSSGIIFGKVYFWRCTYFDQSDHPSLPSNEASFLFGKTAQSQTNTIDWVRMDGDALWKHASSVDVPPITWKDVTFNDSAWGTGLAPFGVETAPIPQPLRTTLNLGPLTYYFRHRFVYDGPSSTTLILRQMLDDGAIYYLNGREIFRSRMPAGAVAPSTLASSNVGDAVIEGPFEVQVANLVSGTNVLAVEVHQSAAASSDVVFGMSLSQVVVTTQSEAVLLNEVLASNQSVMSPGGTTSDYLELLNPSSALVDLSGWGLTDDPTRPFKFTFPKGSHMNPGGLLVVWCDQMTNQPGFHSGFDLEAGGETLVLFSPGTNGPIVVDSISYGVQVPDVSIGRVGLQGQSWRLGKPTPAQVNNEVQLGTNLVLRFNEWFTNPRPGERDWIEIYHGGPAPISLEGVRITDLNNPTKTYLFPPLSFIGGPGWIKLESDVGSNARSSRLPFQLSNSGENLVLISPAQTRLDLLITRPLEPGISEGRLPDGSDSTTLFRSCLTPGEMNQTICVSPSTNSDGIVISEVHYHPIEAMPPEPVVLGRTIEFVELLNLTQKEIPFFDETNPSNRWRIRGGIEFEFDSGTKLGGGQRLVLVGFNPILDRVSRDAFTQYWSVPSGTQIFGPFSGRLSNGGDRFELVAPRSLSGSTPFLPGSTNLVYFPVDAISYKDSGEWPTEADGLGASLNRTFPLQSGESAQSWVATGPTPGRDTPLPIVDGSKIDRDKDGMPDQWEILHSLDPLSPEDGKADADADGMSNYREYLAGTNPTDPTSLFSLDIDSDLTLQGELQLLIRFESAPVPRLYSLEQAEIGPDLIWAPTGVSLISTNKNSVTITNTSSKAVSARFFRVRVTPTP